MLTSAVGAAAAVTGSLYHMDGVNRGNVMIVLCTSTNSKVKYLLCVSSMII